MSHSRPLSTRIGISALVLSAALGFSEAQAQTAYTWTSTVNAAGTYSWIDDNNWVGTGIPNNVGDTANLTVDWNGNTAGTINIQLNGANIVGILNINDTGNSNDSAVVVAAGAGGSLIFDGTGATSTLRFEGGTNSITAPVQLTDALSVNNVTSATMSGVISGAGSLNKEFGASTTLTLSGANTFSGGTTLTTGTLNVNNGGTGGASSAVGTGTLTILGGTLATTATSAVTISTNNAQQWNGDFTFGGTQSLNLGTGAVTLSANRTITLGTANRILTVGGAISGTGLSLSTANATAGTATGFLALNGANTYTGGTNINGGVVSFGNAAAIPATGAIIVNTGGALAVSGAYTTPGAWLADSRLSTTSTGALSLAANSSAAFSPGTTGHQTLSLGANTGATVAYTGAYTPGTSGYFVGGGGGTINFSNTGAFTGSSAITAGNGGGGTVIISGDNPGYTGTATAVNGTLQFGNGGTTGSITNATIVTTSNVAFNRSDALGYSGVITGSGSVTKLGANTMTFNTAQAYTGATIVSAGTLAVSLDNALSASSALRLGASNSGGTFDTTNFNQVLPSLVFQNTGTVTSTALVGAGKTLTISGNLSVGTSATGITTNGTISGGGALNLNGTTGVVNVGVGNTTGNTGSTSSATLNLSALSSVTTNIATLNVAVGNDLSGRLFLSETTNSITATSIVAGNSGTSNGSTGTITLGSGTSAAPATNEIRTNSILLGEGKAGGVMSFASQSPGSAGSVVITGKAGGTSTTDITIGAMRVVDTSANPASTLDLRGHQSTVQAGALVVGINSRGANTGSNTANFYFDTGTFTANSVNMAAKTGNSSATSTGLLQIGGGTFTVGSGGFTLASQAGAGRGNGTLTLSGGTLTSGSDITDGGGTTTSTLTLSGGTLDLTGKSIGGATNKIDVLTLASGTLQNVLQINGGDAITKTSDGTLTFAGVNGFTGQTNVSAGTLLVNGSIAGAVAASNAGSVVGGSGTIGGAVTLNAGTNLAPGVNTGRLSVTGGTTLAATTTLTLELNGNAAGTSYDQLATGGISIDSTSNIVLSLGYAATLGQEFILIDNVSATPINGAFANLANGGTINAAFGSDTYQFTANYEGGTGGNDLVLTVSAVPEPTTALTLLGGLGVLGLLRRRSRLS